MARRQIDCFGLIGSTVVRTVIMMVALSLPWQRAMCQSHQLQVTITTEKMSATVTEADISVDVGSNLSYIGGGNVANWVAQPGLLVTDPVVPPRGFTLQATMINWAAIKEVEFFACKQTGQQPFQQELQPQKLTLNSGEAKDVYLWYRFRGELTRMGPQDLTIAGNMSVAGKIRGVEFQADGCKPLRLAIQVAGSKVQ